ncbi:MAG: hypothetical protein M1352_03275 [Patescibacteria group bacterium]|nr:hypothetical protein [Patescibacteria group bacterium]
MNGKVALVTTFLIFFTLFLIPLRDTDFGWHYRCGEMIVKTQTLCHLNNFTTLLKEHSWYSPSQGYQILIYFLYNRFGFAGITVFYAVSAAFVLTFFLKSLSGNWLQKIIFFLILLWLSWSVWLVGFRSQIISFYFFAIVLALIEISKRKPEVLLTVPAIMIIWANSHPGFFLGPILMTFWSADVFVRYKTSGTEKKNNFIFSLLITALCFLTTLANPYGIKIYLEVLRHTQVPLNTLIAEWVAPPPWLSLTAVFFSFYTAISLAKDLNKNVFRILLIVFVTVLAVEARRNLPLYSMGLAFAWFNENGTLRFNRFFNHPFIKQICLILILILIGINARQNLPIFLKTGDHFYCQNALVRLPCEAASFMKKQNPGNIFNAYEWGGFLDWQLTQFKIFVDGRMPTWDTRGETSLPVDWRGKSPYTIYIETLQTQPGWQEILKAYNTEYLVIQTGTFMDLELKENWQRDGFKQIYNDGIAAVYKKI